MIPIDVIESTANDLMAKAAIEIPEDYLTGLKKAAETVPILLVEQNLKVVKQLAGPCIVLEGGQVVHTGDSNELLDSEELTMKYLGVHSGGKETGVS